MNESATVSDDHAGDNVHSNGRTDVRANMATPRTCARLPRSLKISAAADGMSTPKITASAMAPAADARRQPCRGRAARGSPPSPPACCPRQPVLYLLIAALHRGSHTIHVHASRIGRYGDQSPTSILSRKSRSPQRGMMLARNARQLPMLAVAQGRLVAWRST